jgi:hypothetical protein
MDKSAPREVLFFVPKPAPALSFKPTIFKNKNLTCFKSIFVPKLGSRFGPKHDSRFGQEIVWDPFGARLAAEVAFFWYVTLPSVFFL